MQKKPLDQQHIKALLCVASAKLPYHLCAPTPDMPTRSLLLCTLSTVASLSAYLRRISNALAAIIVALDSLCSPAHAEQGTNGMSQVTLPVSNRNPLVNIHGLPVAPTLAFTQAKEPNGSPLKLSLNLANYSLSSQSSSKNAEGNAVEAMIFDGELFRSELGIMIALGPHSAVSVTLPYLAHHSGNSDQPIEQWHSIFALPNGNRDQRAQDLLLYEYQVNNAKRVLLERNTSGVGDLQLAWQYALPSRKDAKRLHSLRMNIKLPTGDEARLTGSGTTSASVDWTVGQWSSERWPRLSGQTTFGALWLGKTGLLKDLRKDWAGYGSGSIAYRLGQRTTIKCQLDLHSALYHSATDELGRVGGQLALGGSVQLSNRFIADLYFTEDIVTSSSPDFGLGVALHYRP